MQASFVSIAESKKLVVMNWHWCHTLFGRFTEDMKNMSVTLKSKPMVLKRQTLRNFDVDSLVCMFCYNYLMCFFAILGS